MSLADAIGSELMTVLHDSGARLQMTPPARPEMLRPMMVIVETINVCNSACVFCPYTIQTRPKGLMDDALFDRVVDEYAALGGGAISLTPMVGDVLLDSKLPQRISSLRRHGSLLRPSITTNLYALKRWNDARVVEMLETFARIHVSIYGLTETESLEITKHTHHRELAPQMRRLLALKRSSGAGCEIVVGFRTLFRYSDEDILRFQEDNFGEVINQSSASADYCNWGNSMGGDLPGHAQWVADVENSTPCILLAIAVQVFHDGRVSACACCDYDASDELALGSVVESSMLDLFNGDKNLALWSAHQEGGLPVICQNCTFHSPMRSLTEDHPAVRNISEFIGG